MSSAVRDLMTTAFTDDSLLQASVRTRQNEEAEKSPWDTEHRTRPTRRLRTLKEKARKKPEDENTPFVRDTRMALDGLGQRINPGFLECKVQFSLQNILQFGAYCTLVHTSVWCMLQFGACFITVHALVRCMLQHGAYFSTVHASVQCILWYSAYFGTVHASVQCILQYSAISTSVHAFIQ